MKYFMGCGDAIREVNLEYYENLNKYYCEPNYNGLWISVVGTVDGNLVYNRSGEIVDNNLPNINEGFIIIGVYYKEDNIEYVKCFDIIKLGKIPEPFEYLSGQDISMLGDDERVRLLRYSINNIFNTNIKTHFLTIPRYQDNFRKHYKENNKGIILKLKDNEHNYTIDKRNNNWIKVEKPPTIDAFITSFEINHDNAQIKFLELSVLDDNKIYNIGKVKVNSGLGIKILNDWSQYRYKTVRVKFKKIYKSGHLLNPVLVELRDDKQWFDCKFDEIKLYSNLK